MVNGKKSQLNGDEHFAASFAAPQKQDANHYTLRISANFLLSTILLVCIISHGVGRFSATFAVLKLSDMYTNRRIHLGDDPSQGLARALPPPIYSNKKNIPTTVYSSKHFDSGHITTSENLLARRSFDDRLLTNTETTLDADGSILADSHNETLMSDLHQPSGHHLLVDIKSVNGKFLNSEEKLAKAMIDLVEMSGLTMLSYHCHRLNPVGVSCVGVLLESHISLHTWPIPGAICLDLFTCGPNSLLPILPAIQRLFGVARIPAVHGSIVEKPFMQWAYKLRGFRNELPGKSAGDIGQFLHGWLEYDMKEKVVSVDTKYQKIEIYDVINPRFNSLHFYKASMLKDDSYEASNPELFRPDRVVYLDGILQSRYYGDSAYHEALVHPALFSHPNPKRVAIIGGGEGATLREVLKHSTIDTVTMIEVDEDMVKLSKQYLPEWSDCSMIVGSTPSCFDDPRAEVIYADAIDWMTSRFAEADRVRLEDMYDVIIIDAV
jgi:S-adenosylmethionine decarboxylase proenzyme